MPWFDIGVNLTDKRLSSRIPEILENARNADVNAMAVTGTTLEESAEATALCQQYPQQLYCTTGIHPHYAADAPPDFVQQIAALSQQQGVIAIGECGLDFNRDFSPRPVQQRVFEAQLELACQLQLPVFLHERDAFDTQIKLLEQYRSDLCGGVAHCFTGNQEQMQAYLDLDLYIGVTGWLCDEARGSDLRQAVTVLPLERLLLETDAPYLTPKGIKPRPKFNQPALLPYIAETLADIKSVDINELARHSYQNTCNLFKLTTKENQ